MTSKITINKLLRIKIKNKKLKQYHRVKNLQLLVKTFYLMDIICLEYFSCL